MLHLLRHLRCSPCFMHCSSVSSSNFPWCQKGNQPCSFLSAFVAQTASFFLLKKTLSGPGYIDFGLLSMNNLFFQVGLLALRKPLKTSRKGDLIFGLSFLDCFPSLLVEHSPSIWLFILVFTSPSLSHMWVWLQGNENLESEFSFSQISGPPKLMSLIYPKHLFSGAR